MSKNILQALGKIDAALGGNTDDAINVIDALDQIGERAGSLKNSVDNINSMELKICESGEYDAETGVPTIEDPVKGTFYLTPAKNEEDNNIFNEYYINDDGQWEMFGGASINVNDLFDLSDRMAKGVDNYGYIVSGAIVEGNIQSNKASGAHSHAEGINTTASGTYSHTEGSYTTASGSQAHAEGANTIASGVQSHAEGYGGSYTKDNVSYMSAAEGIADHVEGYQTRTERSQPGNHAEGYQTAATGGASHSEGGYTLASGNMSHAEGATTVASGTVSHAEGGYTAASNFQSHAEGFYTIASGPQSHAEGGHTIASGEASHAEGDHTTANHAYQHVFGEYNIEDPSSEPANDKGTYIEIVGNGTAHNARSNARTLDWSGNETLSGSLTLGKGTADEVTITAAQLKALLATIPS